MIDQLAPDAKQKLLALAMHLYCIDYAELDDDKIGKTVTYATRELYDRLHKAYSEYDTGNLRTLECKMTEVAEEIFDNNGG